MAVSVLIPTRGRPKRFRNTVETLLKTKSGKVEILAYLDEDDNREPYERIKFPELRYIVGPRIGLAKIIHKLIESALHSHMFLGADDIEFQTFGWDTKMVEAMPEDCIGLVYANDNWKRVCNHFMFHQKWVSLTGFFPDDFEHFGPDGYVMKIAKELKRAIYLPDVVIEHLHWKASKAARDLTYAYPNESGMVDRDLKRQKQYEPRALRDIEVLRAYI